MCEVEANTGRTEVYYSLRSDWILEQRHPKIQTARNHARKVKNMFPHLSVKTPPFPLLVQKNQSQN